MGFLTSLNVFYSLLKLNRSASNPPLRLKTMRFAVICKNPDSIHLLPGKQDVFILNIDLEPD